MARVPWIDDEPQVVVFDVNETLLDLEATNALFERLFGDKRDAARMVRAPDLQAGCRGSIPVFRPLRLDSVLPSL